MTRRGQRQRAHRRLPRAELRGLGDRQFERHPDRRRAERGVISVTERTRESGVRKALGATTPIPASVPLWSVVAALGVAALSGIGFGMIPARRAAGLDPVEALRYE